MALCVRDKAGELEEQQPEKYVQFVISLVSPYMSPVMFKVGGAIDVDSSATLRRALRLHYHMNLHSPAAREHLTDLRNDATKLEALLKRSTEMRAACSIASTFRICGRSRAAPHTRRCLHTRGCVTMAYLKQDGIYHPLLITHPFLHSQDDTLRGRGRSRTAPRTREVTQPN